MRHSYLECDGCKSREILDMASDWMDISRHNNVGAKLDMCPRCYARFMNSWEVLQQDTVHRILPAGIQYKTEGAK